MEVTGVEIDPRMEVGRRWLGLGDNPNLRVVADDGRPYLQLTDDRYDVIVVDAYHQPYIPFYLATKEFFALVRERLNPGGSGAGTWRASRRRALARDRNDAARGVPRRGAGDLCASTS